MLLIPAIDIKDGHCVRLRQGDLTSNITVFNFNVFCEFTADLADHGKVHGLSASGRIQVNQMQTFGAEFNPMTGLSNGVGIEDSNVVNSRY